MKNWSNICRSFAADLAPVFHYYYYLLSHSLLASFSIAKYVWWIMGHILNGKHIFQNSFSIRRRRRRGQNSEASSTGWTGWICPILENYCGNFYLMSVLFFFMHLLSSPVTFYDISSDFWYWEIFFLSQTGDNPKGYPLEIFENDHSVFKKSFQISKCDAKTILKKSLKLT